MDRDDLASTGDAELVRRFLEGQESAFTLLVRRHEDRIFALAWRATGNRADALDATQNAFISAFKRLGTFRGESAFATWLYRIAINACHDLVRARARTSEATQDPSESESVPASGDVGSEVAERVDVARALAELPEEFRVPVAMHDLGGFPYEEIALATGAPVGTVKSRISRGRRRLADLLEHPPATAASKDKT